MNKKYHHFCKILKMRYAAEIAGMTMVFVLFASGTCSGENSTIFMDSFDNPAKASGKWTSMIKLSGKLETPLIIRKKVKFKDGVVELTDSALYSLRQNFKDVKVSFEIMMKSGVSESEKNSMCGFGIHNRRIPMHAKQPDDRQIRFVFGLGRKVPSYLVCGGIKEGTLGFERSKMPVFVKDRWYKVELEVRDRVAVTIDGVKIGSTSKSPLAKFNRSGGIVLWAFKSTACFKNIIVENLKSDPETVELADNWRGKDGKPKTKLRGFTAVVGRTGKMAKDNISMRDFEDMKKQWNANIVRFMMCKTAYESFMKDCEAGREPEIVKWLDKAKELGITVVIDLHYSPQKHEDIDFYAMNWNKENLSKKAIKRLKRDTFWKCRENLDAMIKYWTNMAKICKGRKQDIWFDLKNEPCAWGDMPSYPKKWPEWAQEIINAIRAIDKEHAIVIEPGPGGLCWGFRDFPALKGENLIYSVHQYEPHGYSHQALALALKNQAKPEKLRGWPGNYPENGGYWDKDRLRELLAPVVAFQKKHNVRIFAGEFGVVKWNPDSVAFLKDNIDLFEEYGWDWTIHIYRSACPVFEIESSDEFGRKGKLDNALIKPPHYTDRGKLIRDYFLRNEINKNKVETLK